MRKILTLVAILLAGSALAQPAPGDRTIWFSSPTSSEGGKPWLKNDFSSTMANPDKEWEGASLPIGNGSFGGSVLGSVARDRVVLNEKTLWLGGPATGVREYWAMNRKVEKPILDSIRTLLDKGKKDEAARMTSRYFSGTIGYDRSRFGAYTVMGEAYVTTGIDESMVTGYSRSLNLDSAMITVGFSADGVSYTRRYIASYPDSVQLWSYTSSQPQKELVFSFDSPHRIAAVLPSPDGRGLTYVGSLEGNGMQWALSVIARAPKGGTVVPDYSAGTITVRNAPVVEFILAAATDYRLNVKPDYNDPKTYSGAAPYPKVASRVAAASSLDAAELFARHLADYRSLYGRTEISINPGAPRSVKPTAERLADYRKGADDSGLEELYFQYGRYLLIASSREGDAMPANLQGIWANNIDGPWHVDFHNNINVQMNYWPAASTNLAECFEPYYNYISSLVEPGKRTAQDYYGARGWTAAISGNPFGFTAPLNSGDMSWNYNPSAGPWLATQLWDHYLFTRDRQWLKDKAYPIIKESANFATDLLSPEGEYLTVSPSYSPEHGSADKGTTYALAVTRQILTDAIAAATTLGVDPKSVEEWRGKLEKIAPYRIGKHGQLQEWWDDIDDPNDHHRHTNHLFGLHPGNTINTLTDDKLVEACKTTLRQRGDEATGWSMGWKLNHWARLHDGDHAYVLYQNLLKEGTGNNLWDQHPPFQIDGNFGGAAGVAELLLQSHNSGTVQLLPALPSKWADGEVRGLRARGGFEVSMKFAGGKLLEATVVSLAGESCNLCYGDAETSFPTVKGHAYVVRPSQSGLTVEEL